MSKTRKHWLKWLFLFALPIGLGLIVREQRSWLPQLIYLGKDVSEMKLSPDGKFLAILESAGNKANVTVIDAQSGKVRRRITTLVSGKLMCFAPDSKQLVVGDLVVVKQKSLRYQLSIHDLENGKVWPGALLPEDTGVTSLVWQSKNRIVGLGRNCHFINAETNQVEREFLPVQNMLNAITLAPDGQTLATARLTDSTKKKNDGIQLWDSRSKKLLRTLAVSGQSYALAFSENGNMIAGSIASKTLPDKIQIWNTHNGQLIHTFKTPPHPMPYFNMGTIQFSPTENLLAVPGTWETLYLYDADSGKLQRTLHSNTQFLISDLRFSPDGKYLFTLSSEGTISHWRIR